MLRRSPRVPLLHHLYHPHFIHTAASDIHPPIRRRRHVPHRPAARWNRRSRKLLRLRIKPHHGIRLHSRFAVPHHAIRRDGDSIRSRPPSARRRPHLHRARHWIEPPQIPTVVIRKINLVLGIDRHPPRPRALRPLVLRDLH